MTTIPQAEKCWECITVAQMTGKFFDTASPDYRKRRIIENVDQVASKMGCIYRCDLRATGEVTVHQDYNLEENGSNLHPTLGEKQI